MQKQITISNIFREYGLKYINEHKIKGEQKGIINLIASCRTAGLGCHYQICNNCGNMEIAHNSCRNRHCPVCQDKDKQKWLEKRMSELLPVGYYHLTFTIPHLLNEICLQNKKVMYNILFKAASQTILELAKDPKHLGADTGLITVLHTWGQNMMEHPHLHCIMPAGGLSFDKSHWVHMGNNDKFFVHYKVVSAKFRGKFLDYFQNAFNNKQLNFKGKIKKPGNKKQFSQLKYMLYNKQWVVNIQPPFACPEKILEYLARYVFKIAITNSRIIKIKGTRVYFRMKDNKNTGIYRLTSLEINEFIRRFLLHILPKQFFKVRHYGIFTNNVRKKNISLAKSLLENETILKKEEDMEEGTQTWDKQENSIWGQVLEMIINYKKPNCKVCKKGRMVFAGIIKYANTG